MQRNCKLRGQIFTMIPKSQFVSIDGSKFINRFTIKSWHRPPSKKVDRSVSRHDIHIKLEYTLVGVNLAVVSQPFVSKILSYQMATVVQLATANLHHFESCTLEWLFTTICCAARTWAGTLFRRTRQTGIEYKKNK